jgi:hypothetical protein
MPETATSRSPLTDRPLRPAGQLLDEQIRKLIDTEVVDTVMLRGYKPGRDLVGQAAALARWVEHLIRESVGRPAVFSRLCYIPAGLSMSVPTRRDEA